MMKKALSLMLAGCMVIGVSGVLLAKEQKTVATDLVGTISGSINVEYEKPLNKTSYLLLGVALIDSDEDDTSYSGFGFSGGYRRYINDKMNYKVKPMFKAKSKSKAKAKSKAKSKVKYRVKVKDGEGFFVEGIAGISMLELECGPDEDDGTYLSIGGLFGFKYIFDGGFTVEAAAGPIYVMGDDFHDYQVEGIDAAISLKAGYTW